MTQFGRDVGRSSNVLGATSPLETLVGDVVHDWFSLLERPSCLETLIGTSDVFHDFRHCLGDPVASRRWSLPATWFMTSNHSLGDTVASSAVTVFGRSLCCPFLVKQFLCLHVR